MKKFLLVLTLLFTLFAAAPAQAQSGAPQGSPDLPLCLPDAEMNSADCLMAGPAALKKELAGLGMSLPQRPLPAAAPDASLVKVDVSIAKINNDKTDPAAMYASFEDAKAGQNPINFIPPGSNRYISFVNLAYYNDKAYVQLESGEWLRAAPTTWSRFQGLLFSRNPVNSFGWIVDLTRARVAPSFTAQEIGPDLPRYTLVQIYEVRNAENFCWYMIAPNRWVDRRAIRQVRVNYERPEGVPAEVNRWIDINLYDQTLTVIEDGKLVFAALVTTGGEPFYTQPGTFQIYKKKPLETMSGAFEADRSDYYYFEDVPWTMYFDKARAIHGAYWRTSFGYPGSHGCVNLSIGDARWVYDWAQEGDYVYVWDPSGQTPTDPKFYTQGGA